MYFAYSGDIAVITPVSIVIPKKTKKTIDRGIKFFLKAIGKLLTKKRDNLSKFLFGEEYNILCACLTRLSIYSIVSIDSFRVLEVSESVQILR